MCVRDLATTPDPTMVQPDRVIDAATELAIAQRAERLRREVKLSVGSKRGERKKKEEREIKAQFSTKKTQTVFFFNFAHIRQTRKRIVVRFRLELPLLLPFVCVRNICVRNFEGYRCSARQN